MAIRVGQMITKVSVSLWAALTTDEQRVTVLSSCSNSG